MKRTVAVVTLGCSRNEVDSEELAGRLAADGWTLVDDVESAEVALVNTCGFIESAKKDSIDALLEANSLKGHGKTRAVVAVGCMAERYGNELAEALPDTDAILSFDDYQDISARLQSIVAGKSHTPQIPRDRRALLPIAPAEDRRGQHDRPARPRREPVFDQQGHRAQPELPDSQDLHSYEGVREDVLLRLRPLDVDGEPEEAVAALQQHRR